MRRRSPELGYKQLSTKREITGESDTKVAGLRKNYRKFSKAGRARISAVRYKFLQNFLKNLVMPAWPDFDPSRSDAGPLSTP